MKTIQTEGAPFSMTTAEFIHLGKLLDALQSQAETIKQLNDECYGRPLREAEAKRRRAEVFRLPRCE